MKSPNPCCPHVPFLELLSAPACSLLSPTLLSQGVSPPEVRETPQPCTASLLMEAEGEKSLANISSLLQCRPRLLATPGCDEAHCLNQAERCCKTCQILPVALGQLLRSSPHCKRGWALFWRIQAPAGQEGKTREGQFWGALLKWSAWLCRGTKPTGPPCPASRGTARLATLIPPSARLAPQDPTTVSSVGDGEREPICMHKLGALHSS